MIGTVMQQSGLNDLLNVMRLLVSGNTAPATTTQLLPVLSWHP